MVMETNEIAKLTADAIRAQGLDTAQNIRAYAAKAREGGEALAAYCEEVAAAITQASAQAADRIAGYLKRCEDARASLQQHEKLLSKLPEADEVAKMPERSPALADLDALEKSLMPRPDLIRS